MLLLTLEYGITSELIRMNDESAALTPSSTEPNAYALPASVSRQQVSPWADAWGRLRENRAAIGSMYVLLAIILDRITQGFGERS